MTGEIVFVFALLGVTILLFLSDKLRMDIIAVLVILALTLSGQLTASEAVQGFGNSVVVLIAGLFVVGEALSRTGVAGAIGAWIARSSAGSERRLQVQLIVVVAVLSAFMSSTGAVAIFIPITYGLCRKFKLSPSRLMMPIAFASLMGGMLTLIGTPPNLIVSEELAARGMESFRFQSFTPVGLIVLGSGLLYLLTLGKKLLPGDLKESGGVEAVSPEMEHTHLDLLNAFGLQKRLRLAKVRDHSALAGRTLLESRLRPDHNLYIVGVQRDSGIRITAMAATPELTLRAGDLIMLLAPHDDWNNYKAVGLEAVEWGSDTLSALKNELGLVEVVVSPRSRLQGKTFSELDFRGNFGLLALGMQHGGKNLITAGKNANENPLAAHKLTIGDTLLLGGPWTLIEKLHQARRDLLVLNMPLEWREAAPTYRKAPIAVLILLALILAMIFNIVPAVTAVLLAAVAMVLTKCLSMKHAYRGIDWQSLVLIAGMLPMGTALEKTGGVSFIVDSMFAGMGHMGPYALMGALFMLTALFSQFISNTATTVLVAPIGIGIATELGVAAQPMLMAIALGASAAFATPVASPVNTLVVGPGGYRFADYAKVGLPLLILTLLLTLLVVPLLFPF